MGESLSPIAETPVGLHEKESRLNSSLMLCDFVCKRIKLKVALRFESYKLIKIPIFVVKYPFNVLLWKIVA